MMRWRIILTTANRSGLGQASAVHITFEEDEAVGLVRSRSQLNDPALNISKCS